MTLEILIALISFAVATSITPGPNNLMLMASGANYGLRRTVPHMLGISLGHAFMVTMVGVVLLRVFATYPMLNILLIVLSVTYMLWLAWKIANAVPPDAKSVTGKPLTFLQAAAFQWVNPKAWFMAISAISGYAPQNQGVWVGSLMVAAVFAATNLPSITIWAWIGVQVRRWLGSAKRLRAFNISMALLLVASLYPMFM
ncbi:LysE family translocator [Yoonia sediminilitoris]|uniref:Threonine/homoserine/homoserine lactone efflux protein n=1 Tax=Yoonia sediminilitoris TaxID=1286148 RepID=A0A2T6KEP7_9RHOB|nr:LysE family translocator [Yoonia sediminilitoris]PUB13598.1 threonine/homoserine/homoserine lactone efflux protein [Yoonia sediminilitoris]RCW94768.1 threonine/homoserine/homoserine lactone efflux protein [Yoonia sediminilitoris]